MARLSATLLLAALASAEYTTTVWVSKLGNSDKYGYVASVVNADAQHVTMMLDFDSSTNTSALNLGGFGGNYTFGPSSFILNQQLTQLVPEITGDSNLRVQCTQPAQGQSNDVVQCTQTNGDGFARFFRCNEDLTTQIQSRLPNITSTYLHTYGTGLWGSSGVETITWTLNFPEQAETTTQAWCTSDEIPASALTIPFTDKAGQYAVYQVVVTAGQEKLSAYSGPSVALSTITSASNGTVPGTTASAGSSGSVIASPTGSAPPESTGAAGKINAVAPALAGLGVAAVMGML
ncbi:hypothetical protein EKO04_007883 [Ascochyta lentis]|uniref:Uncharacterized protein n=1 Tax=Ascochyta lentis TaxID=205686 RepID=A0A8H7J0W3_9PLEO|nr:hypothetical protein EKO04_007883 [Ascochyta lentis]